VPANSLFSAKIAFSAEKSSFFGALVSIPAGFSYDTEQHARPATHTHAPHASTRRPAAPATTDLSGKRWPVKKTASRLKRNTSDLKNLSSHLKNMPSTRNKAHGGCRGLKLRTGLFSGI
jgi:hypothetical protein